MPIPDNNDNPAFTHFFDEIQKVATHLKEGNLSDKHLREAAKDYTKKLITDLINLARANNTVMNIPGISGIINSVQSALQEFAINARIDAVMDLFLGRFVKKVEEEKIYLDTNNKVRAATHNFKNYLQKIENKQTQLDFLDAEYHIYLRELKTWQEVVNLGITESTKLINSNPLHKMLVAECKADQPYETYLECLKAKKDALETLQTKANNIDALRAEFKTDNVLAKKMLLNAQEVQVWDDLLYEKPQGWLKEQLSWGWSGVKGVVSRIPIAKRAVSSTQEATPNDLIMTRLMDYSKLQEHYERMIALKTAAAHVLDEKTVIAKQIEQLTQLESYLNNITKKIDATCAAEAASLEPSWFLRLRRFFGSQSAQTEIDKLAALKKFKEDENKKIKDKAAAILGHTANIKTQLGSPQFKDSLSHFCSNDFDVLGMKSKLKELDSVITTHSSNVKAQVDQHNQTYNWSSLWAVKTALPTEVAELQKACPVKMK